MLQVFPNSLSIYPAHIFHHCLDVLCHFYLRPQGISEINALCMNNRLTSFRRQFKYHLLKKTLPCANWNNTYLEEKGLALSPKDSGLEIYLPLPLLPWKNIRLNAGGRGAQLCYQTKLTIKMTPDWWIILDLGWQYMNHKTSVWKHKF